LEIPRASWKTNDKRPAVVWNFVLSRLIESITLFRLNEARTTMKLPLHLLLSTALPLGVFGWTSSSAFTGRPVVVQQQPTPLNKHHFVMYNDAPRDPPDSSDQQNMFTVLANTERWLSDTLAASQTDGPSSSNPFTRKEVSYVCENSPEAAMIVAGTFRRLKEAREQGETHGQMEEERLMEKGVLSS
jgi:hypothetical protein